MERWFLQKRYWLESNKEKMRIISGKLKGRQINYLKNITTRPLKDSVKENIFNVINHSSLISIDMTNAYILDLYSGVGSFGLECISRDAKKVTFVEQDKKAFNILKNNLIKLSILNQADIFNQSIENFLENNKGEKYNIFFLDPPFSDKEFIKILHLIKKNKFYKSKHIVVIHRENKIEDNLTSFIDIITTKLYGRSKIIFGIFN